MNKLTFGLLGKVLLVFLIISYHPLLSQENVEKDSVVSAIPISNINVESLHTQQLIDKIDLKLEGQDIGHIRNTANRLYDTTAAYLSQINIDERGKYLPRELEVKVSELRLIEDRIDENLDYVNRVISDYELDLEEIIFEENRWRKTNNKLKTEGNGEFALLSNVINDLLSKMGATRDNLLNKYNEFLSIQNKLSTARQDLDQTIVNIDDLVLIKKENLFTLDSPPIWKVSIDLKAIIGHFWRDFKTLLNVTISYLKERRDHLMAMGFLFLIMLILFTYIGNYYKRLRSDLNKSEKIKLDKSSLAKLEIFNKPISISFLITLIFMLDTEKLRLELIGIVMVIMIYPLLTILKQRMPEKYFMYVVYVFILLLFKTFTEILFYTNSVSRIASLIVSVALFALFVYVNKNAIRPVTTEQFPYKKVLLVLTNIFLVLFSISTIGNIIGNVFLSESFLFSSSISLYSGFVYYTCFLISSQIVVLFSISETGRRTKLISRSREKILRQTTRFLFLFFFFFWLVSVAKFFNIYKIIQNFVTELFDYSFKLGDIEIVPSNLVILVLVIWFTFQISKFIKMILEDEVLPKLSLPRGVPGTISMLTRYAILVIGFIVAILAAGIEMDSLTIIIGGLGVGIGFGLQNIFNNFISGLILAFERPIKVGDIIQMTDLFGTVKEIGIRASTVRTMDGAEVIVPNGNLISNEVINWTLSDKYRRIDLRVGVAYGTDPDRVIKILYEVLKGHEKIMENPPPNALFIGFGDSSLDFRLLFWTHDFDNWLSLQSEINVRINRALADADIEIPFPQRDLHLRSVSEEIKMFKDERPELSKAKPKSLTESKKSKNTKGKSADKTDSNNPDDKNES